ncbi:hypothetical protein VEE68_16380 [Escherichia coli]|nr:hypothetical protein VEE68_16380 [Escherichia coli]
MYQPDFPPVPFRLGLYPVVDSVQWIERLLDAGVRTLQLRIKDRRDEEVEADVVAAIALGRRYNGAIVYQRLLAAGDQASGVWRPFGAGRFASHRSQCHPRGRPAAGRFDT